VITTLSYYLKENNGKGLALTTIGVYIIAFFSLATILLFINSPLRKGARDLYCSAHSQFGDAPAFCGSDACQGEKVELEAITKEEVAMEIAAHSIACLKSKSGCARGNSIVCYTLKLAKNSEAITEKDVTEALAGGGACPVLENNRIVLPNGSSTGYQGCGRADKLKWQVTNNLIKNQSLILIEYSYQNHTILIE